MFVLVVVLLVLYYLLDRIKRRNFPPGPLRFPILGNIPQFIMDDRHIAEVGTYRLLYTSSGSFSRTLLSSARLAEQPSRPARLHRMELVGVLVEPYSAKPAQLSSHPGQPGCIGWTRFQPCRLAGLYGNSAERD